MTIDTPDLEADAQAAARAAAEGTAIATEANPNPRVDYLVRLDSRDAADGLQVTLRYVPDKRVLREEAYRSYLRGLDTAEAARGNLESLGLRILSDLNDELVPRWLQVTVGGADTGGHRVLIEDRQPKWDNPPLIARAGGI